ncbi:MAG: DUF3445 domain-containing protein, partial [Betaproteobacteria bacterium]|nr:DUF3445 domain-containing protein [Betaproteobacteria bacterium]
MTLPDDLFAAPFRMQPGLRRSAPGARHFTPLLGHEPVFDEKLHVITAHAAQALLLAPGFDPQPALQRIAQVLVHEHPQHFALDGDTLQAHALRARVHLRSGALQLAQDADARVRAALLALSAAQAPWGVLALALHEDLAVPHGDEGVLGALAVCVPSHWAPADKIGRPFAAVHAPVADNALLLAAARGLMQLVMKSDDWERYVWTLSPDAHHDAHPARRPPRQWPGTADPHAFVAALTFRLERQTFIALPPSQAVFTIHVECTPLAQVLREPGVAQRLHDSLASMSPAVLGYRGFTAVREALLSGVSTAFTRD